MASRDFAHAVQLRAPDSAGKIALDYCENPKATARDFAHPTRLGAPQYPALYFASWSLSSFMAAAGSTPTLRTLSAQAFAKGSAAFFHCASCASESGSTSWPASAFILAMPSCSNSPHGPPTLPPTSLVRLS